MPGVEPVGSGGSGISGGTAMAIAVGVLVLVGVSVWFLTLGLTDTEVTTTPSTLNSTTVPPPPAVTDTVGAAPSGLQGRFVGIDVEKPVGSYWEATFDPNGRWNGIDSATNVCEGFPSRTFGEFWETSTPNAFGATINVECLEGPNEGMMFDLGEFSKPLIYDPVEDTVLQDTNASPPDRDVTFCRIPCDPYEYYAGPWE
jgi:hypothetical protein